MQALGPQFLPPGTVLGKYELIKGLAVGGMAELYLARMRAIGSVQRLVALKRILPNYAAEQEFVHMFLDEARLTAKLQHPNIGQVFDIGTSPHGLFFTMEYISGENARTLLRQSASRGQRLPLGHALAVIIQIARGLHYAHEQRGTDGESLGVVHRDISPSNIIVSFDGTAKLIDFGVAKARGRFAETRTGVVKGKVSYMSPEQCMGEELDRRSDVFALGILLYELTTNLRLYREANEFLVLRRIIDEDAPPPSHQVASYPLALEGIVLRALARDLDERYQSAEELADALTAFVAENGIDTSTESLAGYMSEQFSDSLRAWRDTVTLLASRPDLQIGPARVGTNSAVSAPWTMRAPSTSAQPAVSGTLRAGSASQSDAYADLQVGTSHGQAGDGRAASMSRWSPKVVLGAAAVLAAFVAVAAAQSSAPAVATSAPAVAVEPDPTPAEPPNRSVYSEDHSADNPTDISADPGEQVPLVVADVSDAAEIPAEETVAGQPDVLIAGQPDDLADGQPADQAETSRKDRTRRKQNRRARRARTGKRGQRSARASGRGSDSAWDPDAALPP